MQHSKCFKLITLLTADELKKAEQFLISPYFNSSKTLLKLFRYVKKYLPDGPHSKLGRVETFRHLYGNAPFKENKLRKLLSRLTGLLREFLAIQELTKENGIRSQLLIKSFSQKESYSVFEREIEDRIKTIKEKPVRDTEFYKEMLWLNQELFFHPDTKRMIRGGTSISEIMNCLDMFFVLSKLEFASEMFTRQEVLSEEHNIHLLPDIIKLGRNELAAQNKLIGLYIMVLNLQSKGMEEELVEKCIETYLEHAHLMNNFDKAKLLGTLINLTLKAVNAGDKKFVPFTLRLYKIAIDTNLMLHKGKIVYTNFINVAVMGSVAHDFHWTKKFILEFQQYLDAKTKNLSTNMAWAYWYYNLGVIDKKPFHFEQAIEYLKNISYSSDAINLRIRSLLLRVYFDYHLISESNESILFDHLNAFEKYASRNKTIAKTKLKSYLDLIKITRKLAKLVVKQDVTPNEIEVFKEECLSMPKIVLKHWLLEKVEELKSSPKHYF